MLFNTQYWLKFKLLYRIGNWYVIDKKIKRIFNNFTHAVDDIRIGRNLKSITPREHYSLINTIKRK